MLLAVKLAVSLLFIWFVLRKVNFTGVLEHLWGADPMQLLWAVATLTAGGFAGAAAWFAVLKSNHYALSYQRVATIYWCGMLFNSFLPSNIGGDLYKGYLLVKGSGGGAGRAAITMLLDRLINLSVLVLIGIMSLCLTLSYYRLTALVAALYLGALVWVIVMARKQQDVGEGRVARVVGPLLMFLKDGPCCAATFTAALLSQGLKIGCHIFLIRSLGLDLAINSVWYIIPLFGVISALPISFGGIGLREYAALWVAGALALLPEELVALSLASHLLYLAVNALGLLPFIWISLRDRH